MDIDTVLARTADGGDFLVKWKSVSILHAHWLSRADVIQTYGNSKLRRIENSLPILVRDEDEWTADGISTHVKDKYASRLVPERILARKRCPSLPQDDSFHYLPPALHAFYLSTVPDDKVTPCEAILVKWKGLSALDSTWEWVDEEKIKFPKDVGDRPSPPTAFPGTLFYQWIRDRIEKRLPITFHDDSNIKELLAATIASILDDTTPILILTDSISELDEWDARLRSVGFSPESIFVYHDPDGKRGRKELLKYIPPSLSAILTTSRTYHDGDGHVQFRTVPFRLIVTDARVRVEKRTGGRGQLAGRGTGSAGGSVCRIIFEKVGGEDPVPLAGVDYSATYSPTDIILTWVDHLRNQILREEEVARIDTTQLEKWKQQLETIISSPYSSPLVIAVKARIAQFTARRRILAEEEEQRKKIRPSPTTNSVPQRKLPASYISAKMRPNGKNQKEVPIIVRTPSQILGVRPDASREEIRIAFRNAVRRTHPDKFPGKEAEFQAIMEAYQSISH